MGKCCAQWMRVRVGSVLSIYIYNGARASRARARASRATRAMMRICMGALSAQRGAVARCARYYIGAISNFPADSRCVSACVRACNCVFAYMRTG